MKTTTINKKSRLKKILKILGMGIFTLVIVGAIGFTGFIAVSFADGITYSNEGKDTKECSVYQLESWNLSADDYKSKYPMESLELTASDNNKVPVAYYSPIGSKDNNTVVIVHGYGGDYVSTYPQIEMYIKEGWNVMAIDQRASGNSKNNKVSFGYYEKLDVMATVQYAREYTNKYVVVHGISMGAHTTGLYASTDHANTNVNAIILDSSFDNMKNMFTMILRDMDTGLPEDYVLWCTDIGMKIKYGYGFKDADVTEALKSCNIPTLVIQGEKDELATVEMGEKIFSNTAAKKKEYWLNGSKHIDAIIDYPVQYKERVFNFLN